MAIEKFKPLVEHFKTGNWIRIQVDNRIYKLRLLEYSIDFGNFDNIPVEFSDVTKIKNGITDVESVLSQASSMASSYDTVQRQASQGEKSNNILDNWIENGLYATNTKIMNAANQNQIWGENGILCRQYDPILDIYNDEQLKIINSTLAITDDNWESTKTAIGKYIYVDPVSGEHKTTYGIIGETIVGKLLMGENLGIYNKENTLTFDEKGFVVTNNVNTITIDPNSSSVLNVKNNDGNILSFDDDGDLIIVGNITAKSLELLGDAVVDSGSISGLSDVAISGKYSDLEGQPDLSVYISKDGVVGNVPTSGSTGFTVSSAGLLKASNAIIYGDIYASGGTIAGWNITGTDLYNVSNNIGAGIGKYNTSPAFWAGSTYEKRNDALFKVSHDGEVTIKQGSFKIGDGYIQSDGIFKIGNIESYGVDNKDILVNNALFVKYGVEIFGANESGETFIDFHHKQDDIGADTDYSVRITQQEENTVHILGKRNNDGTNQLCSLYAGSFNNLSDRRLKNNISKLDIKKSESFIMNLIPSSFKYNSDPKGITHHGFIYDEVESVIYDSSALINKVNIDGTTYGSLSLTEMLADLVLVVQDQNKQIKELQEILRGK